MTKLVACPFCGAEPTLEDHRTMWGVRCTCGVTMLGERAPEPEGAMTAEYWKRFEQSAIDRWNRRGQFQPKVRLCRGCYQPIAVNAICPNCGASENRSGD